MKAGYIRVSLSIPGIEVKKKYGLFDTTESSNANIVTDFGDQ